MTNEERNSWAEYRLLVVDWHDQDLKDKAEIRKRLETQETTVNEKLDAISRQLTEIKVERKIAKWVLGVGLPAGVAAVVSATAKALGL